MKKYLGLMLSCAVVAGTAEAGNDQKAGQAGASELLINPWARSSGMAGAHIAGVRGVEAIRLNVGGLARTPSTSIQFANTRWLSGSDISINALGLAQPVGDNGGVLGLEIMSMNLGEFYQTTVNNPDNDVKFSVRFTNIGVAYAKSFSNSIHGGITVRLINESIPNASAQGIAFDAGIQYTTRIGQISDSADANLRFGVSLRNVGPAMRYSGDGLRVRGNVISGQIQDQTLYVGTEPFEIPSMLNIATAYDLNLAESHVITLAGNFNSNSFTRDQIQFGVEYGFMKRFMVRGGYDYQNGVFKKNEATAANAGFTGGASVQVPFGGSARPAPTAEDLSAPPAAPSKTRSFGVDYSYRSTHTWNGTHSIGLILTL